MGLISRLHRDFVGHYKTKWAKPKSHQKKETGQVLTKTSLRKHIDGNIIVNFVLMWPTTKR
jgi:hypothetical protein